MQKFVQKVLLKVKQDGFISLARSSLPYLYWKWKRAIAPLKLRFINLADKKVFKNRGVRLYIDSHKISYNMKLELLSGFERTVEKCVRKYLPADLDVIELGAGVGFISTFASGITLDSRDYIAVEANSRIIPVLSKNKEVNDADFKIENLSYEPNRAISNLRLSEDFWGSSTKQEKIRDPAQTLTIESTNLQRLVEEYDFNKFALICDIEGGEIDLINNELEFLKRKCLFMIIEFHNLEGAKKARRVLLKVPTFECRENNGVIVCSNNGLK